MATARECALRVCRMVALVVALVVALAVAMLSTFRIVIQDYFAFFRTQMTNLVNRDTSCWHVCARIFRDIHNNMAGNALDISHCDAGLLCLFPYATTNWSIG